MITSESTEKLFIKLLGSSYSDAYKIIALIIIEHVIFLLTFLVSQMINDVPSWLKKIYNERNYREIFQM